MTRACSWSGFERADIIVHWDALAQCAAEPNPFYESWYLLPSLRALDSQGKVKLLCFVVDGQLAGLMPLSRSYSYYGYPLPQLRNWVHDNCFCGLPLVARGMEHEFWRGVLDYCDGNADFGLFLHLMQMPATGPLHDALAAVLAQQERPAATVMHEERAMLGGPDMTEWRAPQDYLKASLSTKKIKDLRRQMRRLGELGELRVIRQDDSSDIQHWINDFMLLETGGWKGRAGSALASEAGTSSLFVSALERAAAAGRLERLALELDGRKIAMLATFISQPGAFSFKTAFDEAYSRFSPGVLLQCENLEILTREDVDWVDSCAVEGHNMIDHIWRERREIARHSIGIGGKVRQQVFRRLVQRETGGKCGGIG